MLKVQILKFFFQCPKFFSSVENRGEPYFFFSSNQKSFSSVYPSVAWFPKQPAAQNVSFEPPSPFATEDSWEPTTNNK